MAVPNIYGIIAAKLGLKEDKAMDNYELVEVYLKESPYILYGSGLIHGYMDRLEYQYSMLHGQGDIINIELYNLERHLKNGCTVENAIERAIFDRFLIAIDYSSAWYSSSPSCERLKHLLKEEKISVSYICNGGIIDSVFNEDDMEMIYLIKESENEKERQKLEFKKTVNDFFDLYSLDYYSGNFFSNDKKKLPLRDAPRYSVKMSGELSNYYSGFPGILFNTEAIVSNEICLLFLFGNDE